MKSQYFVLKPDQRDAPLNVVGTKVTVLAADAETRRFGITFQEGDEGTGPPPHFHGWDECFYVLEGSVEFSCEGNSYTCTPGTLVVIPAGTVHGFNYSPGGGKMLEFTGQGTLAAQMFAAVNSEIPPGPLDVPKILGVLKRNGVTAVV